MLIQISNVLDENLTAEIVDAAARDQDAFEDGRRTAGWHAKAVKHNEQWNSAAASPLIGKVKDALLAHPVFRAAAMPKSFVKLLLSRYRPGMSYGRHVDDALMGGIRTDLSFTVFLSDPESYDGGALVIEGNAGDTEVKLGPGSLVLYPTTSLHRVSEVTSGERLAVAGWVRSFIRSHEDRELLFDLENVIAGLRQAGAGRGLIDPLLKVKANLLRRWVDD